MDFNLIGGKLNLTVRTLPKIFFRRDILHKSYANNSAINVNGMGKSTKIMRISPYSSDSPSKCWQCNYPFKSEVFCKKCKALQELPENLNYFEVIGVQKSFDIESKVLQQKFRNLQNLFHPDRFTNKTEKEKQISENMSALVNKAYTTLSHPLDRGLYMLQLQNLSIPEGSTSLDPEFLMEIMERNEKVEEASKDKEKVIELMAENNSILDSLSESVSSAFKNNDMEAGKLLLMKMKYYASLQTRLKKLKQDLGIVD